MDTHRLDQFKRLFETQREEILERQQVIAGQLEISRDEMADETDLTAIELGHTMRVRLQGRERQLLIKIDEALHRLNDGTFGSCETCHEAIDVKRMEARPTTTQCIDCKEASEKLESQIAGAQGPKLKRKVRLIAI